MHCPPRRSGQLLLLHNSYAILAANPLLLLFRQEFCSSVLRLTFGLVLRNAQMGTAITKAGWEGRREIKKWSISLELFIQNWCKKDSFTLILSQIHYSNLTKSHLGIFPLDYSWSESKTQRSLSLLSKEGRLCINEVIWIVKPSSGSLKTCQTERQTPNWTFLWRLTDYTQDVSSHSSH